MIHRIFFSCSRSDLYLRLNRVELFQSFQIVRLFEFLQEIIIEILINRKENFLLPVTHRGRLGKPAVVVPVSLVSGRTNRRFSLIYQRFLSFNSTWFRWWNVEICCWCCCIMKNCSRRWRWWRFTFNYWKININERKRKTTIDYLVQFVREFWNYSCNYIDNVLRDVRRQISTIDFLSVVDEALKEFE